MQKLSFADKLEIESSSWYRYDGKCELTKQECDYNGVGGKGYCGGCYRSG